MLLIGHQTDRELLKEFLSKEHEVILPQNVLPENFDLAIADYQAYSVYREEINTLKQEAHPLLLPVLILLSAQNKKNMPQSFLHEVDELINMPVDPLELSLRVANLLKSRDLSMAAEKRYFTLAESIPVGICVLQNQRIVYNNPILSEIFDVNSEQLKKIPFLDCFDPQYLDYLNKRLNHSFLLQNTDNQPEIIECQTKNPEKQKWVELRLSTILHQDLPSILAVLTDITERKQREEEIKHLSFYDKLTGLYNRAALEDNLKRLDTNRQLPISIIMADINGLKLVNDAYGHKTGDKLLIHTAEIFRRTCRKEDLIARWGGDEFIIMLPQTGRTDAEKLAQRIKRECRKYYVKSVPVKIALGIATKTEADKSTQLLLKEAEDEMYKNKLMESSSVRKDLISTLLATLKEKSEETEEHAKRLSELSYKFQKPLNLSDADMDKLALLAAMHDIGKIIIPEEILKKPDKLSAEEWDKVKKHSEVGFHIASSSEALAHISQEILHHHERWDGKGYPLGKKGGKIPKLSRIVAIVDAYDVMTSGRPYKPAISKEEALGEIKAKAGTQFDPKYARIFVCAMA